MEDRESANTIRTSGPPEVSGQGREVLSFHLHRYLSGWLRETGCARVMVTVGFDDSTAELGAYRIGLDAATSVRTGWKHHDLEDAWRFGNGRIVWEAPAGEPIGFEVVAVLDEAEEKEETNSSQVLGFVTVREDEGLDSAELQHLARQTSEAIRVARRNSVRLFFEENKERPVKSLLYAVADRLPEWCGCDHSAAVLLTHDLDAMTLEDSSEGAFDVLAERTYFGEGDDGDGDRLVGMAVEADDEQQTVLGDALRRHQQRPKSPYFVYRRDQKTGQWTAGEGEDSQTVAGWHELDGRPTEQTVMLVPLASEGEGQQDLLGFLAISWEQRAEFAPSIDDVIAGIGRHLGRLLRQSPLYTMSVRKLWVTRRVRDRIEAALEGEKRGPEVIEEVIGTVSELVAEHVDVPSFAIGYVDESDDESKGRSIRYVHPHGWTRYQHLELDVDVPAEERVDSGISALAVRLGRPVVLAGGYGEGADQHFKNHLWVDEEAGEIYDARRVGDSVEALRDHCQPLRDYYKPARETAYATLAYPMVFSNVQMGVLTVEVEKGTDWLWWTGFGGHLFWDNIAREMAMGIYWLQR